MEFGIRSRLSQCDKERGGLLGHPVIIGTGDKRGRSICRYVELALQTAGIDRGEEIRPGALAFHQVLGVGATIVGRKCGKDRELTTRGKSEQADALRVHLPF
jgi:hypothetical protein